MGGKQVGQMSKQILILGLSGAGKSLFLKKMMDMGISDAVETSLDSTLGFNQIEYDKFGTKLTLWDLGGDTISRSFWPTFYRNLKIDIVLYIVNISDEDSINKSLKEFLNCINEEELKSSKFFLLFNSIIEESDRKFFLENKLKEEFEKKEMLMQEIRENVIHDIDNRLKHEIFDISKLKSGENKTIELLDKIFDLKLTENK